MEKLIIWIVLLVFFYLMNRISTWKKRAATAFLVVGQRATTKEERKWGYRNALRAGEQKAERFYVYSALEDFMDGKPMMPFKMKLSNGKKIPAIFIDYYIPKRDWNFITEEQRKFVQMVYDFKDGRVSCSRLFKEALAKLDLPDSVTVVFMPCSNQSKYLTRFSRDVYKRQALLVLKQSKRDICMPPMPLFGVANRFFLKKRSKSAFSMEERVCCKSASSPCQRYLRT